MRTAAQQSRSPTCECDQNGDVVGERTRRWALRAAPFAGAAITFAVVLLVVSQPWKKTSHVATRRGPSAATPTSPGASAGTDGSTSTSDTVTGGGAHASTTAAAAGRQAAATTVPQQTTTTVSPWAGCTPAGTQAPQTRDKCWQTFTGPQGNYKGADPSARGCIVHNTGTYSPSHDDLHCSYDATRPGGYTSDGQFNMIRVIRDGRTITIDGTAAPNCATGLIQPGDAVYVDGRGDFDANGYPTAPTGPTTTTKVGDDFKCPDAPSS